MPEDTPKPPNVAQADSEAQRAALKSSVAPESREALEASEKAPETHYEYMTHRLSADGDLGREFNLAGSIGFQFKNAIVLPDNMIMAVFEKVVKE